MRDVLLRSSRNTIPTHRFAFSLPFPVRAAQYAYHSPSPSPYSPYGPSPYGPAPYGRRLASTHEAFVRRHLSHTPAAASVRRFLADE